MKEKPFLQPVALDDCARKYLADIKWVQRDIWKLPATYPVFPKSDCEIFAEDIPHRRYADDEKKRIGETLASLQMVMQGPFWIGDDLIIGGFWDCRDSTRKAFKTIVDQIRNKRVLEIGSMSGYHSFYLNRHKPDYYLSIEPSGFHYQAKYLNTIYGSQIDFRRMFWQDIPAEHNGSFDWVLNCGCLYHEYDIITMVKRTTELLRLGGKTLVATVVLKRREHSDCIKYMPDVYAGDMTYWFAMGEKTLLRIFRSFGCEGKLLLKAGAAGDAGTGKTVEGYDLEEYNYYEFEKTEHKTRPLITIPRY